MSPKGLSAIARLAALRRWTRARFGAPSFQALGLPGGDFIDAGLAALAAGEETIEGLLVSVAAPRLRREGVPLPRDLIMDADIRLYRLLERADPELAHARYLAYLSRATSFADACAGVRAGSWPPRRGTRPATPGRRPPAAPRRAKRRRQNPDDGVDVSLIRWLLGMSPAERLAALQGAVDSIAQLRGGGTTA